MVDSSLPVPGTTTSLPEESASDPIARLADLLRKGARVDQQITISQGLDKSLTKRILRRQVVPESQVKSIVDALEHGNRSVCRSLSSRAFIVLFAVLRVSDTCQAQQRGLYLLAASLQDGVDVEFSLAASVGSSAATPLQRRKARIGNEVLDSAVNFFRNSQIKISSRRWMGVFILALLEDCEINQRLLMESPTRREWAQESFGHIVLSEPSYVLKYISGCVIREMVAHGFPAQGFWPHYTNPELTQKFPKSMVENTQWVKSVIEYIQENDTQSLNPHKTVSNFFALAAYIGEDLMYPVNVNQTVLVTIDTSLCIYLPATIDRGAQYFDISFLFVESAVAEEPPHRLRSSLSTSADLWLVVIHLNAAYVSNVLHNASGLRCTDIRLGFGKAHAAKTFVLALQELKRKSLLRRSSTAPEPLDVSQGSQTVGDGLHPSAPDLVQPSLHTPARKPDLSGPNSVRDDPRTGEEMHPSSESGNGPDIMSTSPINIGSGQETPCPKSRTRKVSTISRPQASADPVSLQIKLMEEPVSSSPLSGDIDESYLEDSQFLADEDAELHSTVAKSAAKREVQSRSVKKQRESGKDVTSGDVPAKISIDAALLLEDKASTVVKSRKKETLPTAVDKTRVQKTPQAARGLRKPPPKAIHSSNQKSSSRKRDGHVGYDIFEVSSDSDEPPSAPQKQKSKELKKPGKAVERGVKRSRTTANPTAPEKKCRLDTESDKSSDKENREKAKGTHRPRKRALRTESKDVIQPPKKKARVQVPPLATHRSPRRHSQRRAAHTATERIHKIVDQSTSITTSQTVPSKESQSPTQPTSISPAHSKKRASSAERTENHAAPPSDYGLGDTPDHTRVVRASHHQISAPSPNFNEQALSSTNFTVPQLENVPASTTRTEPQQDVSIHFNNALPCNSAPSEDELTPAEHEHTTIQNQEAAISDNDHNLRKPNLISFNQSGPLNQGTATMAVPTAQGVLSIITRRLSTITEAGSPTRATASDIADDAIEMSTIANNESPVPAALITEADDLNSVVESSGSSSFFHCIGELDETLVSSPPVTSSQTENVNDFLLQDVLQRMRPSHHDIIKHLWEIALHLASNLQDRERFMTSFLAEYDQAGTRIIDEYFSNLQNSNLVEARDLLRSKKEVEDCFRRFRHAIAADRASIETVRGSIAAMSGSVRSSMETVRGSVEEEQKRSEGLLKAFKDCFCCL